MDRLLIFSPLVLINLWHAFMILSAKKRNHSVRSISESALRNNKILRAYQVIHLLGAISFIFYALIIVRTGDLFLTAFLLCLGAAFDITQAFTLNAKTSHKKLDFKDIHQFTAWSMAVFYLLFGLTFAFSTGVAIWMIAVIITAYIAILVFSIVNKSEGYWFAQMVFFVTVSIIIAASDINRVGIGN